MKTIFLSILIWVSAFAQEKSGTPLAIKTNLTEILGGVPLGIEVGIGKKNSVVADFLYTPLTDYKDQFFLRGGIHQKVNLGYRFYWNQKKAKNFQPLEGIYVQPNALFIKNTKTKNQGFSGGLNLGFQIRAKKSFVADFGLGIGILNDAKAKLEPFNQIDDNVTTKLQYKLGLGWVIY
ncbi:DUF3575 domain-containing protein [Lacihabitans sp. LS3-19]|uniref:DUF3575 domain-containing protein n=1 Tax=Lacihabitans sp. LS3-19 TaxID=2487335 RepID=UPI0020CE45D0|nr:DUF3575 domain-containing protein [Lacihabitans sp. LS3-19]MCP9769721.1 DUF3575 domain-containing protein [Lacihabitans sp. LS3-19]